MPRIRTLTAAGVLAGATVLGGVGLAGATAGDAATEDPAPRLQQRATDDMTTGEPESTTTDDGSTEGDGPTAPTLPDQASEAAGTALAEAPAFDDRATEADDDDTDVPEAPSGEAPDNHGQAVSGTAQEAVRGPGQGASVSEVARSHGETKRADAAS